MSSILGYLEDGSLYGLLLIIVTPHQTGEPRFKMSEMLGFNAFFPDFIARIVAGIAIAAAKTRATCTGLLSTPSAAAPSVVPIVPFFAATAGDTPAMPGWNFGGLAMTGLDL